MEFKILGPGANELQIINALPATFKGRHLFNATSISGLAEFGELTFQNYHGDGFGIWYSNYDILHNTTITGRGDEAILELHMQFQNHFTTKWDSVKETVMHQYKYNLTYVPFINNTASFVGDKSYQTFDVHFTIPYLQRLASYFPLLDTFIEKVVNRKIASVSDADRFLTPEMIAIVNEILQCPFRNGAGVHYVESKVMELLLLALDHMSGIDPLAPVKLSPHDIECLHEAKDLIIGDFENRLSLVQLAHKVGTNDNKLKKGFKYLFGTTVGDYLEKEKMSRARAMILDNSMSFQDISIALGYGSVHSFNKAFKRYYQVTPGYMRDHS